MLRHIFDLCGRFAALLVLLAPIAGISDDSREFRGIAYTTSMVVRGGSDQTLDLYLPRKKNRSTPLLIFFPGGFWGPAPPEFQFTPAERAILQDAGVALAVVRTRGAPQHGHRERLNDAAAAVAFLGRHAGTYGYDPKRIFLAGHSSGGHTAALLLLEPQYLKALGYAPDRLAGIVLLGPVLDVTRAHAAHDVQKMLYARAFGDDDKLRVQASPLRQVAPTRPPVLVISAAQDMPGFAIDARRFTLALRAKGNAHAYHHVVSRNDHVSLIRIADTDDPVRTQLLDFLGVAKPSPFAAGRIAARRAWLDPKLTTEPFWKLKRQIQSFPIDARFRQTLIGFFQGNAYQLAAWPLATYHAVPLRDFLTARGIKTDGDARFLVTINIRDEKLFWRLKDLDPYDPVVVVGIDDEHNLFRFVTFYQAKREYSWIARDMPMPVMARPLGAMIYFRKPPPRELWVSAFQNTSLTLDSFATVDHDPLKVIRDLPPDLFAVMTSTNGCVTCHYFRGLGTQAKHLVATTLAPHGGLALTLESYAPAVWKNFMFDQTAVANTIGVTPNPVAGDAGPALYRLVETARRDYHGPIADELIQK